MPEQGPKSYIRMKRIPDSSNVRSAGYSKRNQELAVRYKSTPQRYIYSDVPYTVYKELMEAPSKGKYLYQNVKGYYPYIKDNYMGEEFAKEVNVPAKSQAQQRYFGWLYSKKKSGDTSGLSDKDKKTMNDMSKDQIRDYAATKRKGLPTIIKKEVEKKAAETPNAFLQGLVNIKDYLTGGIKKKLNDNITRLNEEMGNIKAQMHPGESLLSEINRQQDALYDQYSGGGFGRRGISQAEYMAYVADLNKEKYPIEGTLRSLEAKLDSVNRGIGDDTRRLSRADRNIWGARALAAGAIAVPTILAINKHKKKKKREEESANTNDGAGIMPKTASLMDTLKSVGQNQFIKHVGGGALMGIPLGAAYYGAMGSEHTPLKDRMLDGAERGAIGGAALGTLYHIGRKYYGMPRFKDLVGNRVPRY